jgi:hypothetical protein
MKSKFLKVFALTTAAVCCSTIPAVSQISAPATNSPSPAEQRALRGAIGTQPGVGANANAPAHSAIFLTVSGMAVNDISGQPVGALQYVVLGPNGTADLAVALINGRLIPVPWQFMGASGDTTVTPGRVALNINVDRQRLLQAPSVAPTQLSQVLQDPFLQQLSAFFGGSAQVANQGGFGFQTNVMTGGATNTVAGTNAISPPPTAPGAIGTPVRPQGTPATPGQNPAISPPPDTGPGSVGTPPPAPQPRPGAQQQPSPVQPAPR